MTVLLIANTSWSIYNFRYGLVSNLLQKGYPVRVLAPFDDSTEELRKLGCVCQNICIDGTTKNPWKELSLLVQYILDIRKINPDIILSYTIKPNIYGSLAAARLNIPIVNNITGLGSLFINSSISTIIGKILYKIALRKSQKVFFQNSADLQLFLNEKLVQEDTCDVLPGSGIDSSKFSPQDKPENGKELSFLLIARMLLDKGICEFIGAAEILRKKYPDVKFRLLGALDYNNPSAISTEQMNKWVDEGCIEYNGTSSVVKEHITAADCIVLPSYREGTSRVLLESAAMAKPIVTTDVPGCNNVVADGYNGYLCEPRNSKDLAEKMEKIILLSEGERIKLGMNGRKKIIEEFDENIVILKYMEEIQNVEKGLNNVR